MLLLSYGSACALAETGSTDLVIMQAGKWSFLALLCSYNYVFQRTPLVWNASIIATYSTYEICSDYFLTWCRDVQLQAPASPLLVWGLFTADCVREPGFGMGSLNQAFGLGTAVSSLVPRRIG